MGNTEWVKGLLGDTRVFNNEYQFRNYDGSIESFSSMEELEDYLKEYFLYICELSQTS